MAALSYWQSNDDNKGSSRAQGELLGKTTMQREQKGANSKASGVDAKKSKLRNYCYVST